nr:CPPV231 hypothetical protein [Cooks petrelpox virus]
MTVNIQLYKLYSKNTISNSIVCGFLKKNIYHINITETI